MITAYAMPKPSFCHGAEDDAIQTEKLIRKLRWIGLEDEATRLERALSILAPEKRGSVCAYPDSTD